MLFVLAGCAYLVYPFTQNPIGEFQKTVVKGLSYFGVHEKKTNYQRKVFHYWEGGEKKASENSLLLLHGFGGNSLWTWMRLMPSLAKHRHLVALDLLATRLFRLNPRDYSIQKEVEHVLQFLESQKLEKVDIIGLSVGGWIALRIAQRYPQKVGRLILIESAGLRTKVPDFARLTLDNEQKAQEFLEKLFYNPPYVPNFALKQLIKSSQRIKERYLNALEAFLQNSAPYLMDEKIKNIPQKTLILHGQQDQIVPLKHAERLHQGITNSQLIILEECGHGAVWDAHSQLKKEILNFLDNS